MRKAKCADAGHDLNSTREPANHRAVAQPNIVIARMTIYVWLAAGSFCVVSAAEQLMDGEELSALRSLYWSTNGDHWLNNTGWVPNTNGSQLNTSTQTPDAGASANCCRWYGLTCNASAGRITTL